MTSEEIVSRSLRGILAALPAGGLIQRDERFNDVLSALEYFVPEVLAEIHHEWRREGLDGVLPLRARKVSELAAELVGHCILISDQTVVPVHLRLQIAPGEDKVSWLELRLGQRGERGIVRTPYDALPASGKLLQVLENSENHLDWAYQVTYGERRS